MDDGQSLQDRALSDLLRELSAIGYHFVTPTPATHARVVARPGRAMARSLEDVLGWSLPFTRRTIPPRIATYLDAAGVLVEAGWPTQGSDGLLRSQVRASTLHGRPYLHSAYPTDAVYAVFFGPDTYRFADLIVAELACEPVAAGGRIVDVGTGAGVGGITAARASPGARITLSDINPAALRLARINAGAEFGVELVEAPGLAGVEGPIDLVTINPPYIADNAGRSYRDGGGMHGGQLSLDLTREAMGRLAPGGRMILYTGSAIVEGADPLRDALARAAEEAGCTMRYREIDPDVFGEELDAPAYADVDRIAVVAAMLTRAR